MPGRSLRQSRRMRAIIAAFPCFNPPCSRIIWIQSQVSPRQAVAQSPELRLREVDRAFKPFELAQAPQGREARIGNPGAGQEHRAKLMQAGQRRQAVDADMAVHAALEAERAQVDEPAHHAEVADPREAFQAENLQVFGQTFEPIKVFDLRAANQDQAPQPLSLRQRVERSRRQSPDMESLEVGQRADLIDAVLVGLVEPKDLEPLEGGKAPMRPPAPAKMQSLAIARQPVQRLEQGRKHCPVEADARIESRLMAAVHVVPSLCRGRGDNPCRLPLSAERRPSHAAYG